MCECYKIGGRFIAEDPDCEVHGTVAVQESLDREKSIRAIRSKVENATSLAELQVQVLRFLDNLE